MKESIDTEISLLTINTEKELLKWDLDRLAQELTGKPALRLFPIYLVFYKGKLKGYFQAPVQTVVYPAIHPDNFQPQEYRKIVSSLAREIKRTVGNPLFLLCERALHLGDETLLTLGLKRSTNNAYVYYAEG